MGNERFLKITFSRNIGLRGFRTRILPREKELGAAARALSYKNAVFNLKTGAVTADEKEEQRFPFLSRLLMNKGVVEFSPNGLSVSETEDIIKQILSGTPERIFELVDNPSAGHSFTIKASLQGLSMAEIVTPVEHAFLKAAFNITFFNDLNPLTKSNYPKKIGDLIDAKLGKSKAFRGASGAALAYLFETSFMYSLFMLRSSFIDVLEWGKLIAGGLTGWFASVPTVKASAKFLTAIVVWEYKMLDKFPGEYKKLSGQKPPTPDEFALAYPRATTGDLSNLKTVLNSMSVKNGSDHLLSILKAWDNKDSKRLIKMLSDDDLTRLMASTEASFRASDVKDALALMESEKASTILKAFAISSQTNVLACISPEAAAQILQHFTPLEIKGLVDAVFSSSTFPRSDTWAVRMLENLPDIIVAEVMYEMDYAMLTRVFALIDRPAMLRIMSAVFLLGEASLPLPGNRTWTPRKSYDTERAFDYIMIAAPEELRTYLFGNLDPKALAKKLETKILAKSGDQMVPCERYRVTQYFPALQNIPPEKLCLLIENFSGVIHRIAVLYLFLLGPRAILFSKLQKGCAAEIFCELIKKDPIELKNMLTLIDGKDVAPIIEKLDPLSLFLLSFEWIDDKHFSGVVRAMDAKALSRLGDAFKTPFDDPIRYGLLGATKKILSRIENDPETYPALAKAIEQFAGERTLVEGVLNGIVKPKNIGGILNEMSVATLGKLIDHFSAPADGSKDPSSFSTKFSKALLTASLSHLAQALGNAQLKDNVIDVLSIFPEDKRIELATLMSAGHLAHTLEWALTTNKLEMISGTKILNSLSSQTKAEIFKLMDSKDDIVKLFMMLDSDQAQVIELLVPDSFEKAFYIFSSLEEEPKLKTLENIDPGKAARLFLKLSPWTKIKCLGLIKKEKLAQIFKAFPNNERDMEPEFRLFEQAKKWLVEHKKSEELGFVKRVFAKVFSCMPEGYSTEYILSVMKNFFKEEDVPLEEMLSSENSDVIKLIALHPKASLETTKKALGELPRVSVKDHASGDVEIYLGEVGRDSFKSIEALSIPQQIAVTKNKTDEALEKALDLAFEDGNDNFRLELANEENHSYLNGFRYTDPYQSLLFWSLIPKLKASISKYGVRGLFDEIRLVRDEALKALPKEQVEEIFETVLPTLDASIEKFGAKVALEKIVKLNSELLENNSLKGYCSTFNNWILPYFDIDDKFEELKGKLIRFALVSDPKERMMLFKELLATSPRGALRLITLFKGGMHPTDEYKLVGAHFDIKKKGVEK